MKVSASVVDDVARAKSASLFVGGGFTESQTVTLIPLIHGYASELGVQQIYFDSVLPSVCHTDVVLQRILSRYRITTWSNSKKKYWRAAVDLPLTFITLLLKSLALALSLRRDNLLVEDHPVQSDLKHSVWDEAVLNTQDGQLSPSRLVLVRAGISIAVQHLFGLWLVRRKMVRHAFLGHTVYRHRALASALLLTKVQVFGSANSVIFRLFGHENQGWNLLSKQEWSAAQRLKPERKTEEYWHSRLQGKASYEDARTAVALPNVGGQVPPNIVFLHIFRDSPFSSLDQTRIFSDYIDWIMSTLTVLKESPEEWMLRSHPNAGRWGEDQVTWIRRIGVEVFGKAGPPQNIQFHAGDTSNISLLEGAKRVVTFGGTVHLEAAALGIKPVTITQTPLHSKNPELCFKPVTREEYSKLLLRSSSEPIFRLDRKDSAKALKALHFLEEMLPSYDDTGQSFIYRADPPAARARELEEVLRKMGNWPERSLLGRDLACGVPRTIGLPYRETWAKLTAYAEKG